MAIDEISSSQGLNVATTSIWDVNQIYEVEVGSPEFKELLVRLYQNIANIANVLDLKDSGFYDISEFLNGQTFFPINSNAATSEELNFRQVFRLVVNFGALPNTGTKSVAHGIPIDNTYIFTRIYATGTDPIGLTYIPIPFASPTLANAIQLDIDSTNVNITTGSNRSNYTICYVILEYLKG